MIMANEPGTSKDSTAKKSDVDTNDNDDLQTWKVSQIPLFEDSTEDASWSSGCDTVPSSPAKWDSLAVLLQSTDKVEEPRVRSDDLLDLLPSRNEFYNRETRARSLPERRPSFVRKQIIAMEKELELENIEKKVTNIYTPKILFSSESVAEPVGGKPQTIYLNSTMAMILIVSIMTGSAMMTVPYYLKMSNWFGVFLIILLALNSLYAGMCLGWSWLILEETWPEYSEYSRIPYEHIANRAVGIGLKYFVGIIVDISVLGICSVYMIYIADSMEYLTGNSVRFCYLLLIVTFILLPFIMFGSYRNVWVIGIIDVALCVIITLLSILGFFLDKPSRGRSHFGDPDSSSVILALGGFSNAYGYGPVLSNILLDMKDRTMFSHTLATSVMIATVLYVLLAIMGFAAYGVHTPYNVLQMVMTNMKYQKLGSVAMSLCVIQVMTSFVLFLLPTLLAFEERIKCPNRLCTPRVLLRAAILGVILLVVLLWPSLTKYAEIVGATSVNLATFIIPPIAYVCLVYQQSEYSRRRISKKEWILIVETVLLGFCLAFAATITRFEEHTITNYHNRVMCFKNMTNINVVRI